MTALTAYLTKSLRPLRRPAFGRPRGRMQPRTILVLDNPLRVLVVAMMPAVPWMGRLTMPAVLFLVGIDGRLSPARRGVTRESRHTDRDHNAESTTALGVGTGAPEEALP